mgnify:CR=1 FL=1
MKKKVLGVIVDCSNPQISDDARSAYILRARDYKGVQIVVLSECDRVANGIGLCEVGDSRSEE